MANTRSALNLFLDTQVFDCAQYNLSSRDFRRLIALVTEGYARIFLTSITLREIESVTAAEKT